MGNNTLHLFSIIHTTKIKTSDNVPVWVAQLVLGTEVGSHPLPASSGTAGSPPGLPRAEGVILPALGPEESGIQNTGHSFRQQS